MHPFFRQPRALAKLGALAVVFLLAFCLYGLYCINTVTEVKINGPQYKRIVEGKDIIADILPPPEYLIETYLTAFQLLQARDAAETSALIARFGSLKAVYQERHAYWQTHLPDGDLKRELLQNSYGPAKTLLAAIENEFIPAVQAGNKAAAAALLEGKLKEAYQAHRACIDSVVELAKRRNQDDEARAAVMVRSRIYGQMVVGLLLLVMLVFFCSYVFQQIEAAPAAAEAEAKDSAQTRA